MKNTLILLLLCFVCKAQNRNQGFSTQVIIDYNKNQRIIDSLDEVVKKIIDSSTSIIFYYGLTDTERLYIDTGYILNLREIKPDTIIPYSIVGVYGDGQLKMFNAKYLIHYMDEWSIIGAWDKDLDFLLEIYSYDDWQGRHTNLNSICHPMKKGEKKSNWYSDRVKSVKCCK